MGQLKHKWTRIKDDYMPTVGIIKQWTCDVCGCLKTLGNYKFAEPDYIRSGQVYTHYIECIDMDKENLKTID